MAPWVAAVAEEEGDEAERGDTTAGEDGPRPPGLCFSQLVDKALLSEVQHAAWCPTMDLLAMSSSDCNLVVHRLNWQKLWAATSDSTITAMCWQPNGKTLAVGHEDGSIWLHDVENGDIVHRSQPHKDSIATIDWVEEDPELAAGQGTHFVYKDRTLRFFPPPPAPPPPPGQAPTGAFDVSMQGGLLGPEGGVREAVPPFSLAPSGLSILVSGDASGVVSLSALGSFPIGRLELRDCCVPLATGTVKARLAGVQRLSGVSIVKVSLTPDLCHLSIVCRGMVNHVTGSETPTKHKRSSGGQVKAPPPLSGLFLVSVDTTLLGDRRKELQQVALQASSVILSMDGIHTALAAMEKLWQDAMAAWSDKWRELTGLMADNGLDGRPRDELLALLSCGTASGALHQFLVASLAETGVKRLARSVDGAGTAVHGLIAEYLEPVLEMVAFRLGELRGLARWRARMAAIGLDEAAMDEVTEEAGMTMVHAERLLRETSNLCAQHRTFFTWLLRSVRQLNDMAQGQPSDMLPPISSAAVADFLRTRFDQDPLGPQLSSSLASGAAPPEPDLEEEEAVGELAAMGGFTDPTFLRRSLRQQIGKLQLSIDRGFRQPTDAISPALRITSCTYLSAASDRPLTHPASEALVSISHVTQSVEQRWDDRQRGDGVRGSWEYFCIRPMGGENGDPTQRLLGVARRRPAPKEEAAAALAEVLTGPRIAWGDPAAAATTSSRTSGKLSPLSLSRGTSPGSSAEPSPRSSGLGSERVSLGGVEGQLEAVAVALGAWPHQESRAVVDAAFYKDGQVALLFHEEAGVGGGSGWLMLLPCTDLPFQPLDESTLLADDNNPGDVLQRCLNVGAIKEVEWGDPAQRERLLVQPHPVAPLAVSGKRGIACVFVGQRRALLFDLEDNEATEDGAME